MNQDSSFPPMLPPSTELGALLFAILPCLQETYRPLASFAYHMTELTRLKTIPSIQSLSGLSGIDTIIADKDRMLYSLNFYGKMFRMPLLSTIATLLQGWQFYQAYKDILPGLFSGPGGSSNFGGFGTVNPSSSSNNNEGDLFSMLGGLSPDLLASLFSGFSSKGTTPTGEHSPSSSVPSDDTTPPQSSGHAPAEPEQPSDSTHDKSTSASDSKTEPTPTDDPLYNTLYSFLTPEQQKIYEQLMHTD